MIKTKSKPRWYDYVICIVAGIFVVAICNFAAYIPALRSLPEQLYDKMIVDRIIWSLSSATFYVFWLSVVMLVVQSDFKYRPPHNLVLWSVLPYTLTNLLFGYAIFNARRNSSALDEALDVVPMSRDESEILAFYQQADLKYYLSAVIIGYLVLIFFKGYQKRMLAILSAESKNPTKKTRSKDVEEKRLLDEAQKLANTFADTDKIKSTDPDSEVLDVDFFAFIYGEGFDYVIINEGYAIPFVADDDEPIDTIFEGIFIQINSTLYIRADHIMLFDLEKHYIIISPALEELFEKINRKSVQSKLYSYRCQHKPASYYQIEPTLVDKIKSTFKMD
ncbi:hypothetical protein [Sphingobacterium athyrii]|uniref:Uncharacterized protein n=1 Tax=Sphingobacterium athyrii TaxID=2152717 RepID=A0A363NZP3_9SPHI|nr:hypothetical protein [Sphingobacterium athyrii]PUV26286.1 hypothetical protein DCO56_04865 [Sphingobacterium athyrii]